ncbi:MAG: 50S ribosomal protein L10 [Candidatus Aenigmatarchaeota archaeon]
MLRREDKAKIVEEVKSLAESHRTVGVLNMSKMPARQFLKIKNAIVAEGVKIKMARKGLLARALKECAKPGMSELAETLGDSPALIFSNLNAFKLFALLKKTRATSAAKAGAIVTKDVVIPKGPTSIPPGPAISTLSKVGLKTRVEGGKIAIIDEKVVLKAGQAVSDELAMVLGLLKIEPIEVALRMTSALEDGTIYSQDVLDVNVEQYVHDIEQAVRAAINVSINTGYVTKLTAPLAISLAFWRAKSLCVAANILEKDAIGELLAKAVAEAKELEAKVRASDETAQPQPQS